MPEKTGELKLQKKGKIFLPEHLTLTTEAAVRLSFLLVFVIVTHGVRLFS